MATRTSTPAWVSFPVVASQSGIQPSTESKCLRAATVATAAAAILSSSLLLPPTDVQAAEVAIYDHDKTLTGADFHEKDLRGAVFTKAVCKDANFAGALLDGAQLDDANVRAYTTSLYIKAF